MMLATESLALAGLAYTAAGIALRHHLRYWRNQERNARVLAASAALFLAALGIALDETYWGYARAQGMPSWLVYGLWPGVLKAGSALFLSMMVWLYTIRYRLAKALLIAPAFLAAAHAIDFLIG